MLLETLDIKKNDVVIFSRNIFDMGKNFKIIYKDDPQKVPHKISYNEVCRFVNEFTPKNIIVYRLLTNIKDFEIYLSKYGFYLSINNIIELIYFDPVFAIKELENYSEAINYYDLRFRIQQVGLTTLNRKGNLPNYAEIYSIDLEATEAKFQNDMAFAQAIFAFADKDNSYKNKLPEKETGKKPFVKEAETGKQKSAVKPEVEKSISPENKPEPQMMRKGTKGEKDSTKKEETEPGVKVKTDEKVDYVKSMEPEVNIEPLEISLPDESAVQSKVDESKSTEKVDDIKIIKHDISKDEEFDYKQIMKINFKGTADLKKKLSVSKNEIHESVSKDKSKAAGVVPRLIKHDNGIHKTFGSILKNQNVPTGAGKASKTGDKENSSMIIDIFKSPASLKSYLSGRENKKVVLKMSKK